MKFFLERFGRKSLLHHLPATKRKAENKLNFRLNFKAKNDYGPSFKKILTRKRSTLELQNVDTASPDSTEFANIVLEHP